MHPILEDHLEQTEPPAMIDLYRRAHALFDEYGLEEAHMEFEDLMVSAEGSADGRSTTDGMAIYYLTQTLLKQILDQHQIRLSEEAKLEHYVVVLEFIKKLDSTELLQDMLDALRCEDFDNVDKFARCLLLVCDVPEEESMTYLEFVADCTVKVTTDFVAKRLMFEEAVEPLDPNIKRVYVEFDKFTRAVGGAEMKSHKYLFEEDGAVCLPFATYFKMNTAYLMGLQPEDMILECIGFSIISSDGFDNPAKIIMDTLQEYVGELDVLTKIQMKLQQTLLQYRNEMTSGVTKVV